jgi:hypothetical protein
MVHGDEERWNKFQDCTQLGSIEYSDYCADKGRIGSYTKLCDFTLLFMILQVELRLNKGSLVRPRLVDQVKARATIMTICEH